MPCASRSFSARRRPASIRGSNLRSECRLRSGPQPFLHLLKPPFPTLHFRGLLVGTALDACFRRSWASSAYRAPSPFRIAGLPPYCSHRSQLTRSRRPDRVGLVVPPCSRPAGSRGCCLPPDNSWLAIVAGLKRGSPLLWFKKEQGTGQQGKVGEIPDLDRMSLVACMMTPCLEHTWKTPRMSIRIKGNKKPTLISLL